MTFKSTVIVIGVYSAFTATSCAVTDGCAEMYCSNALGVALVLEEAQEEARYEADLATGGTSSQCVLSLATKDLEPGKAVVGECDRPGFRLTAGTRGPGGACPGFPCDSWPEGKPVLQFGLDSAPEVVELEVKKDGETIVRKTLKPSYATEQPNGPGCEPTCRIATIQVE